MSNKTNMKQNPFLKILDSTLISLPSPSSISFNWNFGSLLASTLIIQIITGIILTFHYTPSTSAAFSSIIIMSRDHYLMWLIRWAHSNGASMFFIFIYAHIARNLYYNTYTNLKTWMSGVSILFLLMATAFLGYVLPWGQMSLWGAAVITNLMSAIPILGSDLVTWLWGGLSLENPTLKRFFSFHFILPLILLMLAAIHLILLHETGSNNPLGLSSQHDKITFHPHFITKDLFGITMALTLFLLVILFQPLLFNDPENFIPANPSNSPIHIQPEWYFLFAYAILRSIPNKLAGVTALLLSILILLLPPLMTQDPTLPTKFSPINKVFFWMFVNSFIILTFIGANQVEPPFEQIGQIFSGLYFLLFMGMTLPF